MLAKKSLFSHVPLMVAAGFVIGLMTEDLSLTLIFAVLAGVIAYLVQLRLQLTALEQNLQQLKSSLPGSSPAPDSVVTADDVPATTSPTTEPAPVEPLEETATAEPATAAEQISPASINAAEWRAQAQAAPQPQPGLLGQYREKTVQLVSRYFTEGNLFVRIGLLVLFAGVAFLLKYASDHSLVSIETRLSFIGLVAMALLVIGWRLRHKKHLYGLLLQGGGVGILYLVIFAAYQLHHLIPSSLALVLLAMLGVSAALLAAWQNARSLAVMGIVGGFLAPILSASGSDNYIGLFSYYVLVNLLVLVLAWYRSWRVLNWLSFVFTYVIAGIWGVLSYTPERFLSVEPFLIIFFVMYNAISVLFALRRSVALKNYVDATLVFGNPIIAFGYQLGMVKQYEYGVAISALVLGGFYLLLARVLWRRLGENLRLFAETTLSLSIIFITLAIPFALDSSWTTACWALEGAGIFWVSLRQDKKLAQLFALLLQLGAAVMLVLHNLTDTGEHVFLNPAFSSSLLISLSGFFIAWLLSRQSNYWLPVKNFALLVFGWALFWWLEGLLLQILVHFEHHVINALLLVMVFSAWSFWYAGQRLAWQHALKTSAGLLFVCVIALLLALQLVHPLAQQGYWGWAGFYAVAVYLAKQYQQQSLLNGLTEKLQVVLVWVLLVLLSLELKWQLEHLLLFGSGWRVIFIMLLPALVLYLLLRGDFWPLNRYRLLFYRTVGVPLCLLGSLWFVFANIVSSGSSAPLPYIPFINPLDMMLGTLLMLLLRFWRRAFRMISIDADQKKIIGYVMVLLVFVWMNTELLRLFHHYFDVPFRFKTLWRTQSLQASLSILWTLVGMLLMTVSSRKQWRQVWIGGAVLIGLVILKLVTVDLAASGSIQRIVSFIAVGGLLVGLGYFSPIPPASTKQESLSSE